MAESAFIELQNISVSFAKKKVLSRINLNLQRGEIVSLIGPNGAGKTTLVRVVLGLVKPTHGKVVVHQEKMRIGYMPQRMHIDQTLPINVSRFLALQTRANEQTRADFIAYLGIGHLLESSMQQLSGGELQRVLLARALFKKPQLLVLDEPAQGLDIRGQAEFYGLVRRIRDEYQCAILLVSHDLHFVMAATDSVICLNHHVCCHGHPEHVSKDPAYLELFGKQALDNVAVYTHHHDHQHTMTGEIKKDD